MSDIPKPPDTGSDGSQEISKEMQATNFQSPMAGLPIARVVEGLAATRSKSMGGEIAAGLIAGSFTQISHELYETKQELKITRSTLEQKIENLSDYKQRAAVLEERVRSNSNSRHLRNLSIAVGTTLVGIAIEFLRNKMDNFSYITGALGFLLILLGWLSADKEASK